jgi:hypothetical protein
MDNRKLENKAEPRAKKSKVECVKCFAACEWGGHKVGDKVKVLKEKFNYMRSRGYVKK